jgi:hypothetical protein
LVGVAFVLATFGNPAIGVMFDCAAVCLNQSEQLPEAAAKVYPGY